MQPKCTLRLCVVAALALTLLACSAPCVSAAPSVPYLHGFFHNSPVTEVADSRSIKELLKLDQPYLVFFYINHSAHCKSLVPNLIDVAKQVDPHVGVLGVDAANHHNSGVLHYYEIDEYPKLMFYRHGSLVPAIPYDEGPDVHTMVTWLRDQIKPALELAGSATDIYGHEENQVVVYLDSQRATYQKEILQLADVLHHHHELRVIEVSDAAVARELGLQPAPTVALFRALDHHDAAHALIAPHLVSKPAHNPNTAQHHEPLPATPIPPSNPAEAAAAAAGGASPTGAAAVAAAAQHAHKRAPTASFDLRTPHTMRQLREWIALNQLPLLGVVSKANFHTYLETDLPMFWLFTNDTTPGASWTDYQHALLPLAERYRGRVVFVSGHNFLLHAPKLHLSGHHFPSAVLVVHKAATATSHIADPKKYPMDETIKPEHLIAAMEAHLNDYFGGRLKPHLKSLPAPPRDAEASVQEVVGTTFEQEVLKNANDVVLCFYSPWGEHSDYFHPIFEELAAQMQDVPRLVFLKFDATRNDWPRALFPVKGYPAVFFFKQNKAKPIQFHGNLTAAHVTTFIRHHASAPAADIDAAVPFMVEVQQVLHHLDTQGSWSIFRSDAPEFAANVRRVIKEFQRRNDVLMSEADLHHRGLTLRRTGADGMGDHDHPLLLSAHQSFKGYLDSEAGYQDHDHEADDDVDDEKLEHSGDHLKDEEGKAEAHEEMEYFDETYAEDDHLGEHEAEEDEDEHEHTDEHGEHHEAHHETHEEGHEEHHDYGQHDGEYDPHEIKGDHDDEY